MEAKSNKWDLEPEVLQEDHTDDWFGAYESYRLGARAGLAERLSHKRPPLSELDGDPDR